MKQSCYNIHKTIRRKFIKSLKVSKKVQLITGDDIFDVDILNFVLRLNVHPRNFTARTFATDQGLIQFKKLKTFHIKNDWLFILNYFEI